MDTRSWAQVTKQAAHRTPPAPGTVEPSEPRARAFDPHLLRQSSRLILNDPIINSIENKWSDRQQHGRVPYETMLRHAQVAGAFNSLKDILVSKKPHYRVAAIDPTPTQTLMQDFANHIVSTLDWRRFIEGPIGMALMYGFSLTEMTTRRGTWRGRDMILLDHLTPLPQASLDHGFIPREELSELALETDPRYRCFEFYPSGHIKAIIQYHMHGGQSNQIRWEGPDLKHILHVKHRGGDGNPYGESMFYPAFSAWGDLYTAERIEAAYIDTSSPYLFGTYKTQDGTSRPALHTEVGELLSQQSPFAMDRFLMWANGDLKSVAPTSADFVEHMSRYKRERSEQIWVAMGFPKALIASTEESEADTRNLFNVFFKFLIRAHLAEVEEAVDTIIRRLIFENFGNVEEEDLPVASWATFTENEMRVIQTMIPLMHKDIKSDKLPEFYDKFIEGSAELVARKHEESVEMLRPRRDSNDEPNAMPGSSPPPKEPGEDRVREDQQTDNPSSGE